jgi:uncharacterized protein (TIGR03067 family)
MEPKFMSTKRCWFFVAASLALAIFATARAAADATDDDLKKVEGKWTAPSGGGGTVTYTFKGKTLKIEAPTRKYEMTIILDATVKPEKTIDFKIDEGPDDAKGKTSKGIYKFDGDSKFVFCFRGEGDRPTKYEMIGFEQILIELTRVKS